MIKPGLRRLGILAIVAAVAAGSFALAQFVREHSATARARRMKNPVLATPAALAAGKLSYAEHCQRCHGARGDGQGEKSAELAVAPTDFTNAREMGELADGQLFQQITEGNLPMPAFADKLSEEQRWQLIDCIRTFAPGTAPAP